jgi:hypothetical protein
MNGKDSTDSKKIKKSKDSKDSKKIKNSKDSKKIKNSKDSKKSKIKCNMKVRKKNGTDPSKKYSNAARVSWVGWVGGGGVGEPVSKVLFGPSAVPVVFEVLPLLRHATPPSPPPTPTYPSPEGF